MSKNIHIIGKIDKFKKITAKNGKDMAFMTISDEYGDMECTIFSEALSNIPDIDIGDIAIIYGKTNSRNGKDQIIVNSIKIIEKV